MKKVEHPLLLIVLDGWGHSDETEFNAIHMAHKPTWDELWDLYPHMLIRCSGTDVGLPDEQMGNSEVGHMHIGAGRTVNQDLTRISKSIETGEFNTLTALTDSFAQLAKNGRALHVMGLLSPGGVHSHESHIDALVELAKNSSVPQIFVHAFLDGRDTPPRSAAASLERIMDKLAKLNNARLASIVGRYYAMDRNKIWERSRLAYELIVNGTGQHTAKDPLVALAEAYERDENDEFVTPVSLVDVTGNAVRVEDGDGIVFANFRADRARQLTAALTEPDFDGFNRQRIPQLSSFVTMTNYSDQFDLAVAFPPLELHNTLGEWLTENGLRQLRIAETEKYAHVTFFLNGGREELTAGEERILIASPAVATYDEQPEMSAVELTDALVAAIESRKYDAIVCNYANADMVGHTGNFPATVKCIEALDKCLARIVACAKKSGTEIIITADHGNAEKMRARKETSSTLVAHTAHTNNLVPLIYIGRPANTASSGCLSDIAPTMLTLMGLDIPAEMTGRSLVTVKKPTQFAA